MRRSILLLCLWLAPPGTPDVQADTGAAPAERATGGERPVPFGPGELLTYEVRLGIFTVGESSLRVVGIEPTRGIPTYRVEWRIEGGIPFYRVDNTYRSWIDVERLVSLRFLQDQQEGSHTRYRDWRFFPEEGRWERADNDEKGRLATPLPLDDLSFIYFARSLELEVGRQYRFDRYFKDSGNPVVINVLRRDERKVPAGTFKTIVLQPVIQSEGLFAADGHAEIHLSDDPRRLLVYLRSEAPALTLTLHLKSVRDGVPLESDPVARAVPP